MNDFIVSAIYNLEKELTKSSGDILKIKLLFTEHVRSNFLNLYLQSDISLLSKDEPHNPVGLINKIGIHFINNENLEYSVRLCGDFSINENAKWMGMSQIWVVKGKGSIKVEILELPNHIDINTFQKNIRYTVTEEKELYDGDLLVCEGPLKMIKMVSVNDTMLLEVLSIKDKDVELYWTFNNAKNSIFSECSTSSTSRLASVLHMANHLRYPISDEVIDKMFEMGDSNLKLLIIEKLFYDDNQIAFYYLEMAVNSQIPFLSEKCRKILDLLN